MIWWSWSTGTLLLQSISGPECSIDCQLTYGLETSAKMTSFFRDQVSCLSDWFISWNECEQVVTLYSLLRKITSTQARFLAQVLEHILQNCTDSDAQESYANDAGKSSFQLWFSCFVLLSWDYFRFLVLVILREQLSFLHFYKRVELKINHYWEDFDLWLKWRLNRIFDKLLIHIL